MQHLFILLSRRKYRESDDINLGHFKKSGEKQQKHESPCLVGLLTHTAHN